MNKFFRKFRRVTSCILFFLFLQISCFTQKHDYVWLSGYDSNVYIDSSQFGWKYGNTKFDFNYSPVSVKYDSLQMNFDFTNTSFCDSEGNLLFYTNGIYIANALDEKIENSDSLNAGYIQYEWAPDMQVHGYRTTQGVISIQKGYDKNQYYLLHTYVDSLDGGSNILGKRLYVTTIDMSANNGHGVVLDKNQTIVEDNLAFEIVCTKHANGRDWWALIQRRNTNCYFRVFIDENGTHFFTDSTTCGGGVVNFGNVGSACFSPDGNKFVNFNVIDGIKIFDFDRCLGQLYNPTDISLPIGDSSWIGNGVAISPNNRFLYVSATKFVFQYDLWAADIVGSVDTVGFFDGFAQPFGSFFNTAQLAPNGKIYVSCGNSEADYHVINNPDLKGDSCNFVAHGVFLPTLSLGVPNFPNYRLGALNGSPCDTLSGLNETTRAEKEKKLKVFPNPSTDVITIDYGFTDWNKGEVSLEINSELGQVIYEQKLPMYSGFQKIDISSFSSGIYSVVIKRKGQVISHVKFAKE